MGSSFSDLLSELDFGEYYNLLLDNSYYDIVFPFLLLYAVLYAVLAKVKIFQSKSTEKPYSAVVSVISLVVSWYGVNFELSPGRSIGFLIQSLFPNISALTIMILAFYMVGSILGKDFFKGVLPKDITSYIYITLGVLGLSSVLYYTGIAMGFWDYGIFDENSYWNFALAVALGIMGILFLFIDFIPFGLLFLAVVGVFIKNGGEGSILMYFIDPVVFIAGIFLFLFIWMTSTGHDGKDKLAKKLRNAEKSLSDYPADFGDYKGRVKDIISAGYESNKKKWHKKFGDEKW